MSKLVVYQKRESADILAEKFNLSGYEVIHKVRGDDIFQGELEDTGLFFIQFSLFPLVEELQIFIKELRRQYKENKIVILNDASNIKDIFPLLKLGVSDFINLPLEQKNLVNLLSNLTKRRVYEYENSEVHRLVEEELSLVGESKLISDLKSNIIKSTSIYKPLLIIGEFGTEKFKIANFIHRHSKLSKGPIIRRNMGHIKCLDDGFEKVVSKLFSAASKGTLIFEELDKGDMPVDQFIDYIVGLRGKESHNEKVNLLFLCSISPNQDVAINNKNVYMIKVPALRLVGQDIPHLAKHRMQQLSTEYAVSLINFKESVYPVLQSYEWPGNFFEFHNLLDFLFMKALKGNMSAISEKLLPENIVIGNPANVRPDVNYEMMSSDLKTARGIFEKQYISAQIRRFEGNISNTASFIGMERTALHRKLVSLGINSDNIRKKIKQ